MRKTIFLTLAALQSSICAAYGAVESSELPWNIIAERFSKSSQFCSCISCSNNNDKQQNTKARDNKVVPDSNYCFRIDELIIVKAPSQISGDTIRTIDVNVSKWQEDCWLFEKT